MKKHSTAAPAAAAPDGGDYEIKRLNDAVFGNGRPGLIARMERAETQLSMILRILWLVAGQLIAIVAGAIAYAIRHAGG